MNCSTVKWKQQTNKLHRNNWYTKNFPRDCTLYTEEGFKCTGSLYLPYLPHMIIVRERCCSCIKNELQHLSRTNFSFPDLSLTSTIAIPVITYGPCWNKLVLQPLQLGHTMIQHHKSKSFLQTFKMLLTLIWNILQHCNTLTVAAVVTKAAF